MKPMLAKKFDPDRANYPYYVQRKYNGIRCLMLRQTINSPARFMSRDGHQWAEEVLPHLLTLSTSLNLSLDGELYSHGMSLQQINSRVAVNRAGPHDDVRSVKYYVFDIISSEPFHRRAAALDLLRERNTNEHVVFVESYRINTPAEADYYFNQFINDKYEGMMYRAPDAPYGLVEHCGNKENRWNILLKRKDRMDISATVVELVEGTGKYKNMLGSCQFMLANGIVFYAGSGLCDEERERFWRNKDVILGAQARIEFEMFSDDGTPLKPTIAAINVTI